VMEARAEDVPALLAGASLRENVKQELSVRARRMFNGHWQHVHVAQVALDKNRALEGQSVAQLGSAAHKHPLDFMLDLALEEKLDTLFTATLLNTDEDAVGRMLLDANSMISLSDAGAHLTFLCDAGFGLHIYGYWVREKKLLSLEQAVHRLSAEPAKIFGIPDRGRIAPGMHADLMLFDPATVGRGPSRRVHDLPSGASRLTTPAIGVHGVWVNGVRVADHNGMLKDAPRAGAVLRKFLG